MCPVRRAGMPWYSILCSLSYETSAVRAATVLTQRDHQNYFIFFAWPASWSCYFPLVPVLTLLYLLLCVCSLLQGDPYPTPDLRISLVSPLLSPTRSRELELFSSSQTLSAAPEIRVLGAVPECSSLYLLDTQRGQLQDPDSQPPLFFVV